MALLRRPTWLNVSQVASWGGVGWQTDPPIAQTETLRLFGIQRRTEIAFAEVGQNGDDQLAGVVGPAADVDGGPHGGAGADAAKHAFLAGHAARSLESIVVLNLHHLVHHVEVKHAGDEARADTLNIVLAWLHFLALHLLRYHRARDGLDSDGLEARPALLDDLGDARDGAARADAGYENVRLAVGIVPDFLRGGAAMDLGIGRVLELLRHEGVGDRLEQLVRL